jgi:uncharacterized protein YjeT (DUF2065 family)
VSDGLVRLGRGERGRMMLSALADLPLTILRQSGLNSFFDYAKLVL